MCCTVDTYRRDPPPSLAVRCFVRVCLALAWPRLRVSDLREAGRQPSVEGKSEHLSSDLGSATFQHVTWAEVGNSQCLRLLSCRMETEYPPPQVAVRTERVNT